MTCAVCNRRVQNLGGEWFCETCGNAEPKPNLMIGFTIEDDTGSIYALAFRENAEKILGMELEEILNEIGEAQDEFAPLRSAEEKGLINSELNLIGRVRYNEYRDQLEFMVEQVI